MRKITHVVVHCSATPPERDIGAAEIRTWHLARGWADIGYHWIIRRNGWRDKGRGEAVAGAHVEGWNQNSIGVCLVGGVNERGDPEANFTPAQFATLAGLLSEILVRHPRAKVCGHRDFPDVKKACPSFDVGAWWAEQRDGTAGKES